MAREISTSVWVTDTLKVELAGRKMIVTFLVVAPTTQNYSWTIEGMSNPPSERPTSPFSGLISYDIAGELIQQLYIVGPTITNNQPGTITIAALV